MTEDEVGAWDEVGGAVGLAAVTRFADGPDAAKETGFAPYRFRANRRFDHLVKPLGLAESFEREVPLVLERGPFDLASDRAQRL